MVNKSEVNKNIMPIIEKAVEDSGLTLIEADFGQESGRWLLKIFIYNPQNSVTHEDCESITRKIDDILDELIPTPYSLEVSSPGTDRKLKSAKEYEIFKGKKAKVKLKTGDVFITEINDELTEKYKNGDISYTKLEPEYNFKGDAR